VLMPVDAQVVVDDVGRSILRPVLPHLC
jgi:hypothetical protein